MPFVLFDPLMFSALSLMVMRGATIAFWTHGPLTVFDPAQTGNAKRTCKPNP